MSAGLSAELAEAIQRCNACGFCQANCPIYQEMFDETACPRGRVRLFRSVLEGQQELTPTYLKKIERCIGCMACTAVCPSGVQPHKVILAARAHATERKGLPKLKALAIKELLPNEGAHGLAFALASYAQRLGVSHLVPSELVPQGIDLTSFPLTSRPFRSQVPVHHPSLGQNRERVAFFVGCMIDHSLPQVGHAALRVLSHIGAEVIVPRELRCCGLPLIMSGDLEAARVLAADNLRILAALPVDRIVTACASCGNALRNEYRDLFEDDDLAEIANLVADKTEDIVAHAVRNLAQGEVGRFEARVTYHDPCHLVRGQGVTAEPRDLLRSIPGVDYIELAEADRCCGAGGTFQLLFPDLAWHITHRKIENIRRTQADIVLTACPACIQRLQGGLKRLGSPQPTLHISELLDRALAARQGAATAGRAQASKAVERISRD